MCRLFGLHAGTPVRATFWLLDAPDSLAVQSHREPDGAGIGVFDRDGQPIVDKQPIAAWQDAEFATEAREVTAQSSLRTSATPAPEVSAWRTPTRSRRTGGSSLTTARSPPSTGSIGDSPAPERTAWSAATPTANECSPSSPRRPEHTAATSRPASSPRSPGSQSRSRSTASTCFSPPLTRSGRCATRTPTSYISCNVAAQRRERRARRDQPAHPCTFGRPRRPGGDDHCQRTHGRRLQLATAATRRAHQSRCRPIRAQQLPLPAHPAHQLTLNNLVQQWLPPSSPAGRTDYGSLRSDPARIANRVPMSDSICSALRRSS